MEYLFAKFLKAIFFPPGIFLFLLVVAIISFDSHRALSKRILIFTTALLFLLSTPIISKILIHPLEKYEPLELQVAQNIPADAIVILSGGRLRNAKEYDGKDVSGDKSLSRLMYGARLHVATQLPILITGGFGYDRRLSLAELMANDLSQHFGIKAQWLETESKNTAENASLSAKILRPLDKMKILLVSDAWHMRRAVEIFEREGFLVTPAPTRFEGNSASELDFRLDLFLPSVTALKRSYFAIHEMLGIAWYQLRY